MHDDAWIVPVLVFGLMLIAMSSLFIGIAIHENRQKKREVLNQPAEQLVVAYRPQALESARSNYYSQGTQPMPATNTSRIRGGSATELPPEPPKVTFADVIGQEEAVEKLQDIVLFLRHADIVAFHDARVPRGVVLHGPEGEGKTLMARAVAGEAGVKFFHVNASDMMEKYIGVGAKRIRDLFEQARKEAPAIIFIDEIDSVGKKRSNGDGPQSDETDVTINALLGEMDGFSQHPAQIIVIGATNRFDQLDRALLRPGRFDRKVALKRPKVGDIEKLFVHYTKKKRMANDISYAQLAKRSIGLSAAAIANICNEAALAVAKAQITYGITANETRSIDQTLLLRMIASEHKQQPRDSVAIRVHGSEKKVRFSDVIGQPGAIEEVKDIVDFLHDPRELIASGAQIPSGVLLSGAPGLGKTLLARAIAGEADVPFFSVSGSDFVEMFVGMGAKRVRELYEQARQAAPAIVFIDEIDAVGKARSDRPSLSGNDEREQTLNQLLVEMDGFSDADAPVITIAATNRPELLDAALRRPGRFDRQVLLDTPDTAARLALFQYHLAGKKVAEDVDVQFLARNTSGFTGASIEKVCNEAVYIQRRRDRECSTGTSGQGITALSIDEAITRETIGAPRRSRIIPEHERLNAAVHEGAGHAAVYHVLSGGALMARVTIMPNGNSGGHVQLLNDDIRYQTRAELSAKIAMALAGRVAQEEILGVADSGASSDFEQAGKIALAMVVDLGMSDLGILPKLDPEHRSESLKQAIETQVKSILSKCEAESRQIIRDNRAKCDRIVQVLLEKETILGTEFQRLWDAASD